MRCHSCDGGYTGYIVKKKNLWYYKCRTKGCCSNKSAKKVNAQFVAYLSKYEIKDVFIDDLLEEIIDSFDSLNEANKNQEQKIKASLNELQKKIDKVEEKYFVSGEMTKETYEKFMAKFAEEKAEILSTLRNTAVTSSNLENYLETVASFSSKLATT
jgi:site-specific DNA recombinase